MTIRKFVVIDDQMLTFCRRLHELQIRFRQGTLNPKFVNDALQKIIEGCYFSSVLKIWKTIHLGTGFKNDDDFITAIVKSGCQVIGRVEPIMRKLDFTNSISQSFRELDLCVMTTEEIIGRQGTEDEIYAGIEQMGGKLLPAEAGPQLRLQYLNQPAGEVLFIAMRPFIDYHYDGSTSVFLVHNDNGRLLLNLTCSPFDSKSQTFHRWVFSWPRSE